MFLNLACIMARGSVVVETSSVYWFQVFDLSFLTLPVNRVISFIQFVENSRISLSRNCIAFLDNNGMFHFFQDCGKKRMQAFLL